MYAFLSVLTGVMLAVMVSVNGNLTAQYGTFPAAAIIHAVGCVVAAVLCAAQKEKRKLLGHRPLWLYAGGAIGVVTTVFQNFAFGHVSMTSLLALGLLGQTVASLLIDRFGLFGMNRRPFPKEDIPGLAFALLGILIMLDSALSNARLAEKTGALRSSLINHLVGLPITVLIAWLVPKGGTLSGAASLPFRPWIYLGGAMGVAVVSLCNVIVPRVSAYRLTVLTFIGQVFAGILLDLLAGNKYADVSFWGGIAVAVGVALNYILECLTLRKAEKEKKYWARIKQVEDEHRRRLYGKYALQRADRASDRSVPRE